MRFVWFCIGLLAGVLLMFIIIYWPVTMMLGLAAWVSAEGWISRAVGGM